MNGWCSGALALYLFSANQRIMAINKMEWFCFCHCVFVVLVVVSVCLSVWLSVSASLSVLRDAIPLYQGPEISISRARAIGVQPAEITSMCTTLPAAHNLVFVAMICASEDVAHYGQGIAYQDF